MRQIFSDRQLFWIACMGVGAFAAIALSDIGGIVLYLGGVVGVGVCTYVAFSAWDNV